MVPERERSEGTIGLVAARVGQRCAPEVVGEQLDDAGSAEDVGVARDRHHVVVHEVAEEGVRVTRESEARGGDVRGGHDAAH